MSPKKHPGTVTFSCRGVTVSADFNDYELCLAILNLYERFEGLHNDGSFAVAKLSIELIAEADVIVTKALGQEQRDKVLGEGKKPMRETIEAIYALVTPAGQAYEAMFADYTPKVE